MRRQMLWVSALAVVVASTSTLAGSKCKGCVKTAKAGEGFCCGKGKVFALEVKSKAVFDVLAGSEEMTGKMKDSRCSGCKEAASHGGSCDHCKVFVADGRTFRSRPAYVLASGKMITPAKAKGMKSHCADCAKGFKNAGFCDPCNAGFVGNRMYKGKESYDEARAAYEVVEAAVKDAGHCDQCAIARLTDGSCKHCSVSFKNGKPSKG